MSAREKQYLKDWPWRVESYDEPFDGGTLMAWRVVADVTNAIGERLNIVVADGLDRPTAEIIAKSGSHA